MTKLVLAASTTALTLFSFSLTAQYTDTTQKKLPVQWKAFNSKRACTYKTFIVPTVLVAYGILSLHTDAFQDVNETVKEEIFTERSPRKTSLDNYLQYSPALTVYGLNLLGVHGKNNFRDRTIIYGISNLMMGVTVYAVKNITAETRPDKSNNFSFPSGHTATAFAAAEFLRQEYKDLSPWYGIAGYAAAAATGYLRISNNKHWIGDVFAGAGVGILSTKFAYWMYPSIRKRLFRDKEVSTIVMPSYQNGSLGLALAHYF